jgi:RHS repeat-associated protein
VQTSTQTTGASYPFQYHYNLAGELDQETYPSGRVIQSGYDAAGRICWVSKIINNNPVPYASNVVYDPTGPITTLPLSNGVTETWTLGTYQKQPTALVASKSGYPSLLTLGWSYGPDASNNGNVMGATIGSTYHQSFTYDPINRLKTASETGGSGWQQTYVYDAYGNRAVLGGGYTPGNNWTPQVISDTPSAAAALFTGNRWNGAGVQYDNGATNGPGNMTALPGTSVPWSFAYDAENRQTSATSPLGAATSYFYDGDGRRVQKSSGSVTTTYVYDAGGQLAAEYGNGTPPAEPCTTCYLTADHLGSTRMVTDGAGNLVSLHDYLPFGEENTLHTGAGYGAVDGVTQKFTGKERDQETGLDYFGARYLSSAQGRFTSPDEFVGGAYEVGGSRPTKPGPLPYADIGNPQSLNKYVYALDNPLRYIDPDGHSTAEYDAQKKKIYVFSWDGDKIVVKSYKAGNNVAIHNKQNKSGFANGPMPNGDHKVANADQHGATAHVGGAADGPYGSHGIIHVDSYKGVTGETIEGAGLHSGRDGPDSLTHGCIRTTDAAMKDINAMAKDDPLTLISVQNNGANIAGWAKKAEAAGADVDQSAVQRQVASDAKEDK